VKRLVLIALAGAALVIATVVVKTAADKDTGSSTVVAVVGDSITFIARHEISTALKGRYHPVIHAEIGQRIDQMLPTLGSVLRTDPFAVIVDLGTNDVLQGKTHPDWRTGFTRMVAALTPARCVVLTTVSTLVAGPNAAPGVASAINRAIGEAASAHGNSHVVDWNAAVHRPKGATLVGADRIHPSPAGQVALAAMLRAALDHDCHAS
jgi:lysophospholipase L1-like esterase